METSVWRRRARKLSSWLGGWALAVCSASALAQAEPAAEAPLKEIQVAPDAFERGGPTPPWADLLPLPAADPALASKPLVVRLADSHLHAGDSAAYLVNRAETANDASTLAHLGQRAIAFNPQFQRLQLHRLHIVRGADVIDHTLTAPVRFLQREQGLEQGVYSGVITASIVLPDVRVGDTLHLVYTLLGHNPIFGGRYTEAASWEQWPPTQQRRVTLTHAAGRPIAWRWIGGVGGSAPDPEVTESGGLRRLRFEQTGIAGTDGEPHTPNSFMPLRWLQFSEYGSWGEVAAWARELFPQDAALPPALAPLLERLRALPDDDARVSQALQWVQQEIRYYSVALGESSHRPALPAEVLQRRYGDCKDKSLLLTQLLRALGLTAEPVLASLSVRHGPSMQLPTPLAFDHAVVRVTLAGQDHYLDPTRLGQQGALAHMGQALEDADVLPVGAGALVRVVSPNREQHFTHTLSERFRLPAFDGEGTLEIEQHWQGLQAEALRLGLATLDEEQRANWALSGYERRYPGIRLEGAPDVADDAQHNRITMRARFVIPALARSSEFGWSVPYFPANFQGSFAIPEQVSSRRFPLAMPAWPATLHYRVEMQWPDSVAAVTDPSTQRVDGQHFALESTRSFRGNVFRLALRLQPRVPELPAAELPRLMADLRQLDQAVGNILIATKSMVKTGGLLGLGRATLQDQVRKQLDAAVQRASKVIDAGQLDGEDLAGVLCTRAESLSDLGRPADGLADAEQAVGVAPKYARALECRGNLLWASGQFTRAAADYTRALAVAEDPFQPIYRRGQSRFYEGRYDLAAADFDKATAQQADAAAKPYMMLWHAFALRRQGAPLTPALQEAAAGAADGDWPRPALAMMADLLTPEQVIEGVRQRHQGDERDMALAEAWFYVGQHHLVHGRTDAARSAFEAVRSQGITMYVEHVAAGFELARISR